MKRQEVVSELREATHGREAVDTLVGTMPIVVMNPAIKHGGALRRMIVGDAVGPLAQRGLDEALGLAVSLGPVRPGKAVLEPQSLVGIGNVLERKAEPLSVSTRLTRTPRDRK